MVITYYGVSCFKVQSGETVIGFDPPSKKSENKSPKFETNILLISHEHDHHNGRDVLNPKNEKFFVIENPGEYEVNGLHINGIMSFHDNQGGKKHGLNTIYTVEMEGIRICHLGDFGEKSMRDETKEAIGEVDILFVPIGGDTVIDAGTAAGLTSKISPKIVIPEHYAQGKKGEIALKTFLEEMGQEKNTPEDKLTLKKKDIGEEKIKVIVLKSII